MSTHRFLAKQTGLISLFTGISRVLGFVRDLVIAQAFGTGIGAEAFVVSFKIPNLLRDLVGEGAANAAIVPVLTEYREKKKEEFWKLANSLILTMGCILLILSVLGVLFAGPLVGAIAPGFLKASDPEKFPLTVHLTRVIFPYIFLIGLSALFMGILNSLKEFKSSAIGPILLNISMIVCGFWFERSHGPMALVIGVLIGGLLQVLCQLPALKKQGFHFTRPHFKHAGVKKIGKLLLPRAFGTALYQFNVFVDSILASFESIVGAGGQSALYYANRLFQLPLAMFGVALAQALLPAFSTQLVNQDREGFKSTFSLALRSLMLIVLPASIGLVVLATPIIRIIFEHGRFDAYSTSITSNALFFYGFGLLSCSFIKIYANAFYAMHDTRTPVKTMLAAVFLNLVLSLILMKPLKIGGLTLASSISATVNMLMLHRALKKKMGSLDEARLFRSFLKILAAALVMGVFSFWYNFSVLESLRVESRSTQSLYLGLGIFASMLIYLGTVFLFRIEEARKFIPQKYR